MNCELPATGATVSAPVIIAVCLLVAGGKQAIAAGTWTPSQPGDTWYACAVTG
jgi:hypothetical protein